MRLRQRFGIQDKALAKICKRVAERYFKNYRGRSIELEEENIVFVIRNSRVYEAVVTTVKFPCNEDDFSMREWV